MKIYTIADLHLPFGEKKSMDIFIGWDNYTERIEKNWNSIVDDCDTVIIPGDISWAMVLEKALPDFEFISQKLKGNKIILKGNHDYWWSTLSKMNNFLIDNHFDNIKFLNNNSFQVGSISVCGTRGWINDDDEPQDMKVLLREAGRLEASIKDALRFDLEPVAFVHYPPIFGTNENYYILEVLHKYSVKRCYYGHVHGSAGFTKAFQGERNGVTYKMVSADYVNFTPVLVQE